MFEHFTRDERAIEGLPIRLVIALVVGVASLSVMMNMLSGISGLGETELDVQPEPEVVEEGNQSITVQVVDPEGTPIADATVVAKGGTAELDNGIRTATTGENGEASLTIGPDLDPNQAEGTVTFEIKPPASGNYADRRENTEILVIEGSGSS
jgi:hypothetical protein